MTVKKLIKILKTVDDPDIADVTFYVGSKAYDIKRVSQWGVMTGVTIELFEKEVEHGVTIKRSRAKELKNIVKNEIKKK
jgi:hypothetical protein